MTRIYQHLFSVSLLVLSAAPTYAQNSSYTLVKCDLGQSIQKAVDNTRAGGWVSVTGVCSDQGTVRVTKDGITIDGGGTAIVEASGDSQIFNIDGVGRVVISGFTFRGGWPVYVAAGANARILGNVVEQIHVQGIVIDRGSYGEIANNDISSEYAFAGVYVAKNSNADIHDNQISITHGGGIAIGDNSSVSLGGNKIGPAGGVGISVASGSTLIFEGESNTISYTDVGLFCETTGIIIAGQAQVFSNNTVDASAGTQCYVRNDGYPFPLPDGLQP